MFNGIIKHTGKINNILINSKNCNIKIYSRIGFSKNEIGSSVSCSGACLTLDKISKNIYSFYLSKETLNKTNFKIAKRNDIIIR